MSEDQKTPDNNEEGEKESELLRAIREGRKFSLSDVIAHNAGADLMKGASPVTRKRQAEFEVEHYLEGHLTDGEGALQAILLRRVQGGEFFLNNFDQPLVALLHFCEHILASEFRLQDFVREIDVEWGQNYGERPYFEIAGRKPHPEDPYTFASVRVVLTQLIEQLKTGEK